MSNYTAKPGLEGVVASDTAIAAVEQTGLSYRGYNIEDLANNCHFEEVAHLLIFGELPDAGQLKEFNALLADLRPLSGELVAAIRSIPKDAPMMDVLRTGLSMAGHFDPVKGDDASDLRKRSVWLMAMAGAIVSARYRMLEGGEPVEPKVGLSHAAQILYQAQGVEPSAQAQKLLDLTLILYAEHEFNASTFTTRVIASTMSDMVSSCVGAVGALKGPLHGGANEAAMAMLSQFENADQASTWVNDQLANKQKVMGFGHRVYKNGDHRASILEDEMRKLAEEKGKTKWVDIYDAIKNPMVTKAKPIYPNVDYPCGLTYFLLDLPLDLYTPLFVCSRITGWCAHFIEQSENNRIYRPLSRYSGPDKRPVVAIDKR